MTRIENVMHQRYSYSKSNSKRSSIAIEGKLSVEEEDQILDSYPQLVSEDYRGWCVQRLRAKGKTEFIKLADRAIKYGNNPQKLFVSLIK